MSDSPIDAVLRAIDALDIDAAVSLFAPNGTMSTPFGRTATDLEHIRELLTDFFAELRQTCHQATASWNPEPGVWVAETEATYELSDFSHRGPYKRVFVLRGGDEGIEQLRIYGAHEPQLPQAGRSYLSVRDARGWLPTL